MAVWQGPEALEQPYAMAVRSTVHVKTFVPILWFRRLLCHALITKHLDRE